MGVRIDGHGPYPFLLDTGASTSVVSSALATRYHLRSGKPLGHQPQGAACSGAQQPSKQAAARVELSDWKVGATPLPARPAVALPNFGSGTGTIDGLLGSDALSALSAVTIDYRTGRASLGPASTNPAGNAPQVPLDVVTIQGEVVPIAHVTIGAHGYDFVVDTGASTSAVTPSLNAQRHLPVVANGVPAAGVSCSSKVAVVALTHWHVGNVALPTEDVPSLSLSYAGAPPPIGLVTGLVGEDVLSTFGEVTIDFAHQLLTLGP